ncbi:MAG: hypothetical protein IPI55_08755 [Flavobacteriales bacterium]|nr:hypothetical protein [Flavobacteriales bacterium]
MRERPRDLSDRPRELRERPHDLSDRPRDLRECPRDLSDHPRDLRECLPDFSDRRRDLRDRPRDLYDRPRDLRECPPDFPDRRRDLCDRRPDFTACSTARSARLPCSENRPWWFYVRTVLRIGKALLSVRSAQNLRRRTDARSPLLNERIGLPFRFGAKQLKRAAA